MGAVKQALIEVDDFVSGCIRQGRTLNQTVRDALESGSLCSKKAAGAPQKNPPRCAISF